MIRQIRETRALIENSPLARRFLGGAAWSVLGSVVASALNLVTMILVARLLGKQTYGHFVVLQGTLNMVGIFAGFGVGATATKYVAELKSLNPGRLGHILALTERAVVLFGIVATGGLMWISGYLASTMLNSTSLAVPLAIAASAIFFTALDNYQKCVLIGLEAMRAYAIGTVVGTAVTVPIMLALSYAYGLNGVAGAMVFGTLAQCAISRYQVVRESRRRSVQYIARGCLKEWRVLRDFAFPALLGGLLVGPAHWACQAMLANRPNGYSELAILGVAMQWFNVIMYLPNIAGRVVLPILTERVAANDHRRSAGVLKLAVLANLAIAVPAAVIIASISPWIMQAYGAQFREGWGALTLIAAVGTLLVAMLPVGQVIAAGGRMWLGAAMNFGWAIVYVGCALFWIKDGALGVVVSLGIAYLVHSIWTALYATHFLGMWPRSLTRIARMHVD